MSGNDLNMMLFRFGDKVEQLKKQSMAMWPEIPVENMEFFGAEVLASGVVLWSLLNATGLDTMRWPGDLPVVLGLKVSGQSDAKVGQALESISEKANLQGAQVEQMQMTFLELLEWKVVEQLHASLFTTQRQELAKILSRSNFSDKDRSVVLSELSDFLGKSQIDSYTAKTFFENALEQSLAETANAFL